MKVYKAVLRKQEKLVSLYAEGAAEVCYEPGRWAIAPAWLAEKGYHLFAFVDLSSLTRFIPNKVRYVEVWEAEADEIIQPLPPPLVPHSLKIGKIERDPGKYPEGTIMAKRLKLIRRISG